DRQLERDDHERRDRDHRLAAGDQIPLQCCPDRERKPARGAGQSADQREEPHPAPREPGSRQRLLEVLERHRAIGGGRVQAPGSELADGPGGRVDVREDTEDRGRCHQWACPSRTGCGMVSFTSTTDIDGITLMKPMKRMRNHAKLPMMMPLSTTVGM